MILLIILFFIGEIIMLIILIIKNSFPQLYVSNIQIYIL